MLLFRALWTSPSTLFADQTAVLTRGSHCTGSCRSEANHFKMTAHCHPFPEKWTYLFDFSFNFFRLNLQVEGKLEGPFILAKSRRSLLAVSILSSTSTGSSVPGEGSTATKKTLKSSPKTTKQHSAHGRCGFSKVQPLCWKSNLFPAPSATNVVNLSPRT